MSAIDVNLSQRTPVPPATDRASRERVVPGILLAFTLAFLLFANVGSALAGQASTGELLFYPCTSCHPVNLRPDGTPDRNLPNGFKGHQIVLIGHDHLGKGRAACLVCHDDASKDPSKLKLMDGSLIDIRGDISQVCYRCHEAKYKEWKAGEHGRNQPKCTSAGCHDPHTPSWIYAAPLSPFVATGFQTRAVSERTTFTPLPSPPIKPPTLTPAWVKVGTSLGTLVSVCLVGILIVGRPKR